MYCPEFVPCDNCENGYLYIHSKEHGPMATRCSCYTEYLERFSLLTLLDKASLSHSILDYDIDSYIGTESANEIIKVNKYISHYEKKFHSIHLYITGPNGTQKTTIAQYIGRELLKKHVSVKYILMNDLIKTLTKEGFEEKVQEDIDKYFQVDCLIIDEAFDKEKILWYKSNYQMNFLDSLLRKRIDQLNKSTIFISNKSVDSIVDNFNGSIYDLIKRNTIGTVLEFNDHYSLKNDFDPKDLWN